MAALVILQGTQPVGKCIDINIDAYAYPRHTRVFDYKIPCKTFGIRKNTLGWNFPKLRLKVHLHHLRYSGNSKFLAPTKVS